MRAVKGLLALLLGFIYTQTSENNVIEVNSGKKPFGKYNSFYQNTGFTEEIIKSKYNCLINPFSKQDDYAASVTDRYSHKLDELVAFLCRNAGNDLEKARVIFTWIALNISYDDNSFNSGQIRDHSPEAVLKSKKAVCEGYGNLFEYMGKKAGLEIVFISGYAKGITYRKGDAFQIPNHAWNAIKIDGKWKLFDVTWASGYGTGVHGKLVTHKRFNGFWFDTEPDAFIFSHLPEDSRWQLNTTVITKKQFENLPFVEDGYFEMGFDGETCLQRVFNGGLKEFPSAFGIDLLIHVISLPYQKEFIRNIPFRIKINSVKACDIVIFNNKQITHLNKNGNEFSAIIQPQPGTLSVDVKTNPASHNYSTMLLYVVK